MSGKDAFHQLSIIRIIIESRVIDELSLQSLKVLKDLMKRLVGIDKHLGKVHHDPTVKMQIHHGYDLIRVFIQKLFPERLYLCAIPLIE